MVNRDSRMDFADDAFEPVDVYELLAEEFERSTADRQTRRQRKPKHRPATGRDRAKVVNGLAEDTGGLEVGFQTTYHPSRYEQGWLLTSLHPFYDQGVLKDVLALVKGGKEANVYLCQAHESTGLELLAAKVYRPQMFRNLRNDHLYRQGRAVLKSNGLPVKKNDHRMMRAIGKKTAFGTQVSHTSWLMHEYTTLQQLHEAGGAVPRPVAAGDNAVLMAYVGDLSGAAPALNQVSLTPVEAQAAWEEIMRNVELMLRQGIVHGDLSAYNVLYWNAAVTMIDFPQVVDPHTNRNAYPIFARDVRRISEYFIRQGVSCDGNAIADDLWDRLVGLPKVAVWEVEFEEDD